MNQIYSFQQNKHTKTDLCNIMSYCSSRECKGVLEASKSTTMSGWVQNEGIVARRLLGDDSWVETLNRNMSQITQE